MFGNFSRNSFDPQKNYTRVLMQQGCPITDSDWNEQMDLVLAQVRALGTSIYDWYGSGDVGFFLDQSTAGQLKVSEGHIVVDGIVVFNKKWGQSLAFSTVLAGKGIYFELWEYVPTPQLQEHRYQQSGKSRPTLRSCLRWAIRMTDALIPQQAVSNREAFRKHFDGLNLPPASLKVSQLSLNDSSSTARTLANGYYLYRVEIHDPSTTAAPLGSTFKWTRENQGVLTKISVIENGANTLMATIVDDGTDVSLTEGDWVELLDQFEERVYANNLAQVKSLSGRTVTLSADAPASLTRDPNIVVDWHDAEQAYNLESSATPFTSEERIPTFVRVWMPANAVNQRRTPKAAPATGYEYVSASPTTSGISLFAPAPPDTASPKFHLEGGICIEFDKRSSFQRGNHWVFEVSVINGKPTLLAADGAAVVTVPVRGLRHRAPLKIEDQQEQRWLDGESHENGGSQNDLDFQPGDIAASKVIVPAVHQSAATEQPTSLLSDAGLSALKQYFTTPKEVLRRIPARYLKTTVSYSPLAKWLAPALLSEIADMSFEEFTKEFQEVHPIPNADWAVFEREAKDVLEKAQHFSRMMASNAGMQSLLS